MSDLALLISGLVVLALVSYIGGTAAYRGIASRARGRASDAGSPGPRGRIDPGVERRAERKARELLRSVVDADDWEMYRDLGFIRVVGRMSDPDQRGYCYLIYPHKPIVAYLPGSDSLLSEYCVEFPDQGDTKFGPRLPDSDDVIAKWMMIKADEERLIRGANMHLPGRQVDPQQVRRDLVRLREWDRARAARTSRGPASIGSTAAESP